MTPYSDIIPQWTVNKICLALLFLLYLVHIYAWVHWVIIGSDNDATPTLAKQIMIYYMSKTPKNNIKRNSSLDLPGSIQLNSSKRRLPYGRLLDCIGKLKDNSRVNSSVVYRFLGRVHWNENVVILTKF